MTDTLILNPFGCVLFDNRDIRDWLDYYLIENISMKEIDEVRSMIKENDLLNKVSDVCSDYLSDVVCAYVKARSESK